MADDLRDDWVEVDGVLYLRTEPLRLSQVERERKWVRDNWDRLKRAADAVEAATKCFFCKRTITGIGHLSKDGARTVRECDECKHWHKPPPNPHTATPASERIYDGTVFR